MDNLTPITREEMLMNDEPLTPITREEKILAGEDLECVTRREYFLKKYRHAGGDVMVEGLSVTENGIYTAPEGKAYSPVEVAVPLPDNAYLLKEASGSLVSFNDGADLPMPSFVCNIDAVQDLHGYDYPWVGGAGKNKLQVTATTKTTNGVTFTVNSDGTIILNGTATAYTFFNLNYAANTKSIPSGSYIFSGMISGITTRVYQDGTLILNYGGTIEQPFEISSDAVTTYARIDIATGTTFNNVVYRPMIRLSTETDSTFAPYSNICPISGHTGVNAWVRGKNLCPVILSDDASTKGYTATVENDGVIIVNGTWTGTEDNIIGANKLVRFNLPAGSYVLNGSTVDNYNNYGISLQAYNWSASRVIGNTRITGYVNFTLEAQSEVSVRVYITNSKASGKTIPSGGIKLYPMIRLATEQDTTFEPFNPNSQTIQVSWQTEAGEVFGGYVDLVSRVLTVTHKEITFDGVTNGKKFTNKGGGNDNNYYMNCYDGYLFDGQTLNNWVLPDAFSEHGLINSHYPISAGANIGFKAYIGNNHTSLQPRIQFGASSDITTIELANAWLAEQYANGTPWQIKYPLAEAQTYQLTPTQIKSLLGNNNAWCSTGDVDIDYFAKEV